MLSLIYRKLPLCGFCFVSEYNPQACITPLDKSTYIMVIRLKTKPMQLARDYAESNGHLTSGSSDEEWIEKRAIWVSKEIVSNVCHVSITAPRMP